MGYGEIMFNSGILGFGSVDFGLMRCGGMALGVWRFERMVGFDYGFGYCG